MKRKIAFSYYGGKFSKLNFLLPILPTSGVRHYVEPFAGSAAVLLNREPVTIETLNDLDGDIVNFFRVLRDDGETLIRNLLLTPYSKEELHLSVLLGSDLERARRFFVKVRQGRGSGGNTGGWRNSVKISRAGISAAVSKWLNGVEGLEEVVSRLKLVQIENRDAFEVLGTYDSPDTLFYCDPPYRNGGELYRIEFTEEDRERLFSVALGLSGRVAISGYADDFDCFQPDRRWRRHEDKSKATHLGERKERRSEILWTNYDWS